MFKSSKSTPISRIKYNLLYTYYLKQQGATIGMVTSQQKGSGFETDSLPGLDAD